MLSSSLILVWFRFGLTGEVEGGSGVSGEGETFMKLGRGWGKGRKAGWGGYMGLWMGRCGSRGG